MRRPTVGESIRLTDTYGEHEHTYTVADVLSVQVRATREVERKGGGWDEHSAFAFYSDVEWSAARQVWIGKAG